MIALGIFGFFAAMASDYLETRYVRAVHAKRPREAAACSVAMWCIGVAGLLSVLEVSYWVLLPEVAGLWIGTQLAMRD